MKSFSDKLKFLFSLLGITFVILLFQNCGENSFRAMSPSSLEQLSVNANDEVNSTSANEESVSTSNLTAATAVGKVYYVATNGSDSNTGTTSSPFKTIQKAVKVVRAGDTVLIRKGRHKAFDLSNINGAAGKPITFRGELGAIVDRYLGGGNGLRNIEFYGGSYVTIDRLELVDSNPVSDPVINCTTNRNVGSKAAIKLNRGGSGKPYPHHLIFSNLNIHHTGTVGGTADDSKLLTSHIHNNGNININLLSYGTYLKGKRWLIRGNSIHDNNGNGIRTGNDASTSTTELLVDSIIENNLVYDNGGRGAHPSGPIKCRIITGGDGIAVWHGSGNIVRNNIVSGNHGYGIRINGNTTLSTKSNLVYNNTVYKNRSVGIYSYTGEKTLVRNNISFLNTDGNLFGGIVSYNLTTDPKFVNAGARDFRLQAGSPAINNGVTLSAVPTDIRGYPRGRAYDIGAYEF